MNKFEVKQGALSNLNNVSLPILGFLGTWDKNDFIFKSGCFLINRFIISTRQTNPWSVAPQQCSLPLHLTFKVMFLFETSFFDVFDWVFAKTMIGVVCSCYIVQSLLSQLV